LKEVGVEDDVVDWTKSAELSPAMLHSDLNWVQRFQLSSRPVSSLSGTEHLCCQKKKKEKKKKKEEKE